MAAVYSVARRFFRRAAGLYFVDVQEEGEAHVPRTGPVVFAANHPNSLMDTVLLGSRVPRNIHYLARSGLFAHPLAAAAFPAAASAVNTDCGRRFRCCRPGRRRPRYPRQEQAIQIQRTQSLNTGSRFCMFAAPASNRSFDSSIAAFHVATWLRPSAMLWSRA